MPTKRTGSRYSPGATRADHHPQTAQVLGGGPRSRRGFGQQDGDRRRQFARVRQSAGSGVGPGQSADVGVEHHRAASAQQCDVVAGRGMLPHLGMHGGGEQHRGAGGQQHVGEQVVGPAAGGASQQVSRSRRDHDQVALLSNPYVRHLVGVAPHVIVDRMPRQSLPGRHPDETQRTRGGDHHDVVPVGSEPPQQLTGLVGGNAARHPEGDAAHGSVSGSAGWGEVRLDRRTG